MPVDANAISNAELVFAPSGRSADCHPGTERHARLLLDALPMGMLLTDSQGCCLDVNEAALSLLELTYEQVLGQRLSEYFAEVAELIPDGNTDSADVVDVGELRVRRPSGSELIIELTAIKLDAAAAPVIAYFFREISEEVALAEQLRESALTDALTRLPNRYAIEQQVDVALRNISRGGAPGVLCFIDLDNFKSVNDTCGHAAGDALLQMVADAFRQRARATDAIGRIGGDEFALLLNGCHLEDAVNYVAALRQRILNLDFSWDGRAFRIGMSAGLTQLTPRTGSVAEALAEADMACFAAKSAGRCETRVFTERLRAAGAALSADAETAQRLREALASDAIALNAQPLRALRSSAGFTAISEILIRLTDSAGQLIPPSVLLPIAARFGLAQQLDRWVVGRVLDWLEGEHPERRRRRLYVNITASSLVDESFVDFIASRLTGRTVPALGIEIPEHAIMLHPAAGERTIHALNTLGCGVSIDRLSGRADAIEFLAGLPVSLLKLGPEFAGMTSVTDIPYVHAEAMVRIAHGLSRPVAVTGIETQDALRCTQILGAELAQGVAIAPAAPLILPS
jgi:Amt family ammonium transporter